MKHLILGAGNLGKDLLLELNGLPETSISLLSKSRGVDCENLEELKAYLEREKPEMVWYCVGGGSVAEAKSEEWEVANRCFHLNCAVPQFLCENLDPETKLVLFSSDYAADEDRPDVPFSTTARPRSEYSRQKIHMERMVFRLDRPRTTVVRVGSLYGFHKPERTFPGKIISHFGFNELKSKLPCNIVVPTPTRWVAGVLIRNLEKICLDGEPSIEHLGPSGGVSVKDWARFVLTGLRWESAFDKRDDFFDMERPLISGLGNSLEPHANPHWHDLWQIYFQTEWYTEKKLRGELPEALRYKKMFNQEEPSL